jgi:hypothetical protein
MFTTYQIKINGFAVDEMMGFADAVQEVLRRAPVLEVRVAEKATGREVCRVYDGMVEYL